MQEQPASRARSTLYRTLAAWISLAGLCGAASAQTVYYEDSALVSPPDTAFPFYTPGVGSVHQAVRIQFLCPGSFSSLPAQAGIVTHVGFEIAGQATYSTWVLRAGASPLTALGYDWGQNLPDQRVQADWSGQVVTGGLNNGTPVNQWVDIELAYPFFWQPGEAVVVDLTTDIAIPGVYCGTARGQAVERVYNYSYQPGDQATTLSSTGGLKFSMTFAPVGIVSYGTGCSGLLGYVPALAGTGSGQIAASTALSLQNALGNVPCALLLGLSRTQIAGMPLPYQLGGGCDILTSSEVALFATTTGTGPGQGGAQYTLAVPNQPALAGVVLYAQWGVLDPGSTSPLQIVVSNGGIVVVHP